MNTDSRQMKKLDFSKLVFSHDLLSTKESLQDVIPICWSKPVQDGAKKVRLSHPEEFKTEK